MGMQTNEQKRKKINNVKIKKEMNERLTLRISNWLNDHQIGIYIDLLKL